MTCGSSFDLFESTCPGNEGPNAEVGIPNMVSSRKARSINQSTEKRGLPGCCKRLKILRGFWGAPSPAKPEANERTEFETKLLNVHVDTAPQECNPCSSKRKEIGVRCPKVRSSEANSKRHGGRESPFIGSMSSWLISTVGPDAPSKGRCYSPWFGCPWEHAARRTSPRPDAGCLALGASIQSMPWGASFICQPAVDYNYSHG